MTKLHLSMEEMLERLADDTTGKAVARRFSGGMRVLLTLMPDDSYHCVVRDRSAGQVRVTVNLSPHDARTMALDAPEAFDAVAKAAIAFALEEKDEHGIQILSDDTNWDATGTALVLRDPSDDPTVKNILLSKGDSK